MNQSPSTPVIHFVIGPTASGKSARAMELARQHNGVIINADAMQVYEGLPILSAQPSLADQQAIPHRLYGIMPPTERSSAGHWVALAQTAIRDVLAEDKTPILVGGTGLYIQALTEGIAEIPAIPDSIRTEVGYLYNGLGEELFRQELAKIDPAAAARIGRNDRQRLTRAFEVALHTGKSLSDWQNKNVPTEEEKSATKTISISGYPPLTPRYHILMPPRDELYARCDQRFLDMLTMGAMDEVNSFRKRNISISLPAAKTIGLRELADVLEGKTSRHEAIAKAQQATRNYAKRQMTWFRN